MLDFSCYTFQASENNNRQVIVPQHVIAKGLDLDVKTGGYLARKVFKHRLRSSLPSIQDDLWETVQDAFKEEMQGPLGAERV